MNIFYKTDTIQAGFNAEAAAAKALKEFQDHEAHLGFTPEQLAEVHKMAVEKVKAAPKAEVAKPVIAKEPKLETPDLTK